MRIVLILEGDIARQEYIETFQSISHSLNVPFVYIDSDQMFSFSYYNDDYVFIDIGALSTAPRYRIEKFVKNLSARVKKVFIVSASVVIETALIDPYFEEFAHFVDFVPVSEVFNIVKQVKEAKCVKKKFGQQKTAGKSLMRS